MEDEEIQNEPHTNRRLDSITARLKRANKTGECTHCKPHRHENAERAPRKSWKFRKQRNKHAE